MKSSLLFALCTTFVVASLPALAKNVLHSGPHTVWKYHASSSAPAEDWAQVDFDDSSWSSGQAPLGFNESSATTSISAEPDQKRPPIVAWFRTECEGPVLKPGESLVLAYCVDDGAVFYLNGEEIARANMPEGDLTAESLAEENIGYNDEGIYRRLRISPDCLKAGEKNVLAVEVRQVRPTSDDLYMDAAIKILPSPSEKSAVAAAAREIIHDFNKNHQVGFGVRIPDGYIDGGRGMVIDEDGVAESGREILAVDRTRDTELTDDLAFARSPELKALPELERLERLAKHVDKITTPPGGERWVGETTFLLQDEFCNQALLIGDWVDQCQAGVCRHRSLLLKILGDEAGLKVALVRGNFAVDGPPGFAHAWNEALLSDGRRVLIDVMHNGGEPKFTEVSDPIVVEKYLKVDGTPWYSTSETDKTDP